MRVVRRIIVALVAAAMCSCLAPQNAFMVDIDMHSWEKVKSITFENSDTLSLRDLNIAIRYNDKLKETILPLKIAVMAPDTRIFEDTIALQLLHPSTALAVSTNESRPYRKEVVLNQKGTYVFSFKPLIEAEGVEAIGIEFK